LRDGVRRLQRIEDCEKLRLGGSVVPLPVTPEQFQQLLDGLFDLSRRVQGQGIVEPRLVVGGIGLHGGGKLSQGTGIRGLARKFDLGTHGFDLGRVAMTSGALFNSASA
jgi:hypothetical protein